MDDVEISKKLLLDSYKELSLDDKRNEFSKELITIVSIINNFNQMVDLEDIKEAYNYKKKIDLEKTEEEILTCNYEDIVNIKYALLALIKKLLEKK